MKLYAPVKSEKRSPEPLPARLIFAPTTAFPALSRTWPLMLSGPVVAPEPTLGAPPHPGPEPPKETLVLAARLLRFTTSGTNEHPFSVGRTEYDPGARPLKA